MSTSDDTTQPSGEVIPFPLCRTPSWGRIADEYVGRPEKGRYCKAAYAEKVISDNRERLERFGVAPDLISDEIARLRWLFDQLDGDATEKARA